MILVLQKSKQAKTRVNFVRPEWLGMNRAAIYKSAPSALYTLKSLLKIEANLRTIYLR